MKWNKAEVGSPRPPIKAINSVRTWKSWAVLSVGKLRRCQMTHIRFWMQNFLNWLDYNDIISGFSTRLSMIFSTIWLMNNELWAGNLYGVSKDLPMKCAEMCQRYLLNRLTLNDENKGKLFLTSLIQKHVPRDINKVIRSPISRSWVWIKCNRKCNPLKMQCYLLTRDCKYNSS